MSNLGIGLGRPSAVETGRVWIAEIDTRKVVTGRVGAVPVVTVPVVRATDPGASDRKVARRCLADETGAVGVRTIWLMRLGTEDRLNRS